MRSGLQDMNELRSTYFVRLIELTGTNLETLMGRSRSGGMAYSTLHRFTRQGIYQID